MISLGRLHVGRRLTASQKQRKTSLIPDSINITPCWRSCFCLRLGSTWCLRPATSQIVGKFSEPPTRCRIPAGADSSPSHEFAELCKFFLLLRHVALSEFPPLRCQSGLLPAPILLLLKRISELCKFFLLLTDFVK